MHMHKEISLPRSNAWLYAKTKQVSRGKNNFWFYKFKK